MIDATIYPDMDFEIDADERKRMDRAVAKLDNRCRECFGRTYYPAHAGRRVNPRRVAQWYNDWSERYHHALHAAEW